MTPHPRTLFDKLWDAHVVVPETDAAPAVLYIDLHLIHEVTSPQAFTELKARGLSPRRPDRTKATMDHSTPTLPAGADGKLPYYTKAAETQVDTLARNCADYGIELFDMASPNRGIVHVIAPEQGFTLPGMTIVCGDSHTSTHGAFGALAFGIGTSEVGHVLATQCLLQRRPRTMAITVDGTLAAGVGAKDIVLHAIGVIGVNGGTGHVIEFRGSAIEALDMEQRMTLCNMSIEAGARAGTIAVDDTTLEYVKDRPLAPRGDLWERALARWRTFAADPGSVHDRTVVLDASTIKPMITYGTNPGMGIAVDAPVPTPSHLSDASERRALEKALQYMALTPGESLLGKSVDVVFLGSCTNSRISDLRLAAGVMRGRRVASTVRMLVVPGSQEVKRQAEAEGLDEIFRAAGAEWREAGCSMCIAMNGDELRPGQYAVSTSNRNFEGRQGKGGRTFLASPLTAAATAIAGSIADARSLMGGR